MRLALAPIAALAFACGGAPSPVVVGHLTSGLSAGGTLEVAANGNIHTVAVERDGGFSIQDLPTGELVLTFESVGITGEITLHDVAPGELIEIEVGGGADHFEIRVVRREPMMVVDDLPDHRGDLVIEGNHMIHQLSAGVYHGNVTIRGNHITLIGPADGTCAGAIIDGDLHIEGNHINLVNVGVTGGREIRGNDIRIYGGCAPGAPDFEDDDWSATITFEGT